MRTIPVGEGQAVGKAGLWQLVNDRDILLRMLPSGTSSLVEILSTLLPSQVSVTATTSKSYERIKSQMAIDLFLTDLGFKEHTLRFFWPFVVLRDSHFICTFVLKF